MTAAVAPDARPTAHAIVRPDAADHVGLVYREANRIAQRVGCDAAELVGWGTLGLLQALERFDPARGLTVSTYAVPRIRGAIIDGMRADDPRGRRRGRLRLAPLDDPHVAAEAARVAADDDAGAAAEASVDRAAVWAAVSALPLPVAQAIRWRYADGLTFVAIGARLGITEAGALRRVRAAVAQLRAQLAGEPGAG